MHRAAWPAASRCVGRAPASGLSKRDHLLGSDSSERSRSQPPGPRRGRFGWLLPRGAPAHRALLLLLLCPQVGGLGVPSGGRSGGAAGTFLLAWARKCSCTRRVYDTINSWTNVGFSSVQGGSVWSLSSPPTTATPGLLTGPETRAIGARGSLALCAPAQADLAHAPATWTHHRAAAAGR